MLKRILALSIFTTVALGEVVPVSQYIGKHNPTFAYGMTGAFVDNNIYTFGGAYNIPYVVNPGDDEYYGYRDHTNTTDLSYVYDTLKDEWRFETKTPVPWRKSSNIVAGHDIYFYHILSKPSTSNMALWKYDTVTKQWSQKSDLGFLWHGDLRRCHFGGKIYFTSTRGYGSTIIQIYDIATDRWQLQDAIFLDKKLNVNHMLCVNGSIKIFGDEIKLDPVTGESMRDPEAPPDFYYKSALFTVYYNGSTISRNINSTEPTEWGSAISTLNEWLYFYSLTAEKAYVSKLNTITLENVVVDAHLPYNFSQPLFVPTDRGDIFLFGGDRPRTYYGQRYDSKLEVKKWNHKIVTDSKTGNKPQLLQQNV